MLKMRISLFKKNFYFDDVVVLIAMFFVGILIFFYSNRLITTDPMPENVFIVPQEFSKVSRTFSTINTGFILTGIPLVNPNENEFVVEGLLWFEYDPSRISSESINKFSFVNGTIEAKSEPKVEARGNLLLVKYLIKLRFSSRLDYEMFPFDDHRIYFILTNLFLNSGESVYTIASTDFIVPKNLLIPGWSCKEYNAMFGKTPIVEKLSGLEESYPQVIFILKLQKNSLGIIFTIIIPLLIMFYISLISIMPIYEVSGVKQKRFNWEYYSIAIGNFAAVLAYRYVIQTVSPQVSYLTVADFLYIYILSTSVIALVVPFITMQIPVKIARFLSFFLIIFLSVVLIALIYILLFVRV
ncbi:MAG: hypothetical protein US13_C0001G0153 [candidate division TM6 bacterium GW2011_GWE2_36_25]|nr:MAG: hypothetical protein US03_C0001G0051 [candidate division TM6 bacterium GW2011_GWF2_36_131]KKQ03813.1 MAG: hypothetical protein US13_C0001G0153 [candidate division TM6 bacterium GW2011_GWE2_36_25]KKQ19959.1 MAG: hypothetical protein US32_C0003G0076 [candidate division TM6 bacterium GW2011_GWA2_36_9]